jgi:hypothetical protein
LSDTDTGARMPWNEFLAFLAAQGFRAISELEYQHVDGMRMHLVAADTRRKLLIVAESVPPYFSTDPVFMEWYRLYGTYLPGSKVHGPTLKEILSPAAERGFRPFGRSGQVYDFMVESPTPLAPFLRGLEHYGQFVNWHLRRDRYVDLRNSKHVLLGVKEDLWEYIWRLPPDVTKFIKRRPRRKSRLGRLLRMDAPVDPQPLP